MALSRASLNGPCASEKALRPSETRIYGTHEILIDLLKL
jgi:hypothetical protein